MSMWIPFESCCRGHRLPVAIHFTSTWALLCSKAETASNAPCPQIRLVCNHLNSSTHHPMEYVVPQRGSSDEIC